MNTHERETTKRDGLEDELVPMRSESSDWRNAASEKIQLSRSDRIPYRPLPPARGHAPRLHSRHSNVDDSSTVPSLDSTIFNYCYSDMIFSYLEVQDGSFTFPTPLLKNPLKENTPLPHFEFITCMSFGPFLSVEQSWTDKPTCSDDHDQILNRALWRNSKKIRRSGFPCPQTHYTSLAAAWAKWDAEPSMQSCLPCYLRLAAICRRSTRSLRPTTQFWNHQQYMTFPILPQAHKRSTRLLQPTSQFWNNQLYDISRPSMQKKRSHCPRRE